MRKKNLCVGLCVFFVTILSGCIEKVEVLYTPSGEVYKELEAEKNLVIKETEWIEEVVETQAESVDMQKSIREWFDEYRQAESEEAKEYILEFFCNNTGEFLKELSLYEMKETILYLVQWESAVAVLEEDNRYMNIIKSAAKMNLPEPEREVLQMIENGALELIESNRMVESERENSAAEVIQLFHDYNAEPSDELLNEMLLIFEKDPVLFLDSLLCMEYQEQILQAVSEQIYDTGRKENNKYYDVLKHLHQEELHTGTSEMLDVLEKNIDGVKRHEGEY